MVTDDSHIIRVLIVAPTPALRAGLRSMLAGPGLEVVGEASALAAEAGALADVVVVAETEVPAVDVTVPALVVLADNERPLEQLRTQSLAGWGVVLRDTSADELRAAVTAAAQGLAVVPPALLRRLELRPTANAALDQHPAEPLTAREREVLELIGQGLSNKQIARGLQISEHTVKFHVSAIFVKLRASSRTDAVSRAARLGLLSL